MNLAMMDAVEASPSIGDIDLVQYLEAITDSESVQEVWDHHLKAMSAFGFDRLYYGFSRTRARQNAFATEDMMALSNHDPEYVRRYSEEKHYEVAPMVNWANANVGYAPWSWMQQDRETLSPDLQALYDLNAEYDVCVGYTVSFMDVSVRAKGAIGLVARPGISSAETAEVWAEHGRVIVQMNNVMHLKMSSLPFYPPNQTLTSRQREVLEWIGLGKTTSETAIILDLTPATVEKHLRLARETLRVETTAQAVLKASFNHQIYILQR